MTFAEPAEHNIRVFREKLTEQEHITVLQGKTPDLRGFRDAAFDGMLLLGPMYRLYSQQDKILHYRKQKE